jgi:cellulose synthase/poly-beta-1,6-N-acetylglucosamine synthase-like glycosyltransferase
MTCKSPYKAGVLKKGMTEDYVQDCEYVAIFDADFQPQSDFLLQTVPFLIHNPQIALMQADGDLVSLSFMVASFICVF